MKWQIARIFIAIILALQFQVAAWLLPQDARPAQAATYCEVTVTFTLIGGPVGPPSNLILTDLGFVTVKAEWAAAENATYYMVRGSREDYPEAIDEGELIAYVNTTSCNFTSPDLNVNTAYVTVISFQSDNTTYSPVFATASIGGEGMEELADSVTSLGGSLSSSLSGLNTSVDSFNTIMSGVLPQIIAGIIVLALMVFALWKREAWLYVLSGFAVISYGVSYIGTDWRISMLLVLLGMGCFAKTVHDYRQRKNRA